MNELLTINYETDNPTVSARELYDVLSSDGGTAGTERFSKWFYRYVGYGFEEGKDYSTLNKKVRVQLEGNREVSREVEDYDLSIDMAKEICMLQRTEKGKECRTYFIQLEKAWNTPEQIFARALKMADKVIAQKDRLITEMQPKAEYFDELVERNLLTNFRDTAKELGIKEKDFVNFLLSRKYVYRDSNRKLKPYADKNNGLFEIKEFTNEKYAGNQTLITPKGRETFRLLIKCIA